MKSSPVTKISPKRNPKRNPKNQEACQEVRKLPVQVRHTPPLTLRVTFLLTLRVTCDHFVVSKKRRTDASKCTFEEFINNPSQIYTLKKPTYNQGCIQMKFKDPDEDWAHLRKNDKIQYLIDNGKIVIRAYMKPDEYQNHIHNWNNKSEWKERAKIKSINNRVEKGFHLSAPYIQLEYPILNNSKDMQEGRHRSIVAKNYKCKYIPVYLVITKLPKFKDFRLKTLQAKLEFLKKKTGDGYTPTFADKQGIVNMHT